jgi:MFS family permease
VTAAATAPASRRAGFRLVLSALFASGLIYTVLVTLVVPAVHILATGIHGSESDATWILTSFVLSGAVATPIAGRLGDMYGRKRALVTLISISLAGSVLCGLSSSLYPLIVGRLLTGTISGVFPLAYGILRDEYAGERMATAIGVMSVSVGVGTGVGFLLSGVILRGFSYHWLFWFPLALIVPTLLATLRWVPESPVRPGGTIDWVGAALLTVGLLALLVGINEAGEWGWGSPGTLGLIAGALVALVAWTRFERRQKTPLIDMRITAIPSVWRTDLIAVLLGFALFAMFAVIPQFAEQPASSGYGFGDSVLTAGLFLVPSTVGMVATGPLAGIIEFRWGSKPPMIAGSFISAIGGVIVAVADSTPWHIYLASTLWGLGMGLAYAAMPNVIVDAVPPAQTGEATAINTIARVVGGAIGIQVCGTLIAQNTAHGVAANHGFVLAFWVCTASLITATLVACMVPGRRGAVATSMTDLA